MHIKISIFLAFPFQNICDKGKEVEIETKWETWSFRSNEEITEFLGLIIKMLQFQVFLFCMILLFLSSQDTK